MAFLLLNHEMEHILKRPIYHEVVHNSLILINNAGFRRITQTELQNVY